MGKTLISVVGEVSVPRRYHHCPCCRQGVVPMDAWAGLDATHLTPRGRRLIVLAGSDHSFDKASDRLQRMCGVRVAARPEPLTSLLDRLTLENVAMQVALEASGCFLWAFDLLVERLGCERVHVAAPSKVRAIADSQEKNDANDAWWLAWLMREEWLPEAFVAEGDLRELASKLQGHYAYYGITGNGRSLGLFFEQVKRALAEMVGATQPEGATELDTVHPSAESLPASAAACGTTRAFS